MADQGLEGSQPFDLSKHPSGIVPTLQRRGPLSSSENEPASRILELCLLHLAMSEITAVGTRYQIVINETVDLAKRFCDGTAPRIINGCLRTFVKNYSETEVAQPSEGKS